MNRRIINDKPKVKGQYGWTDLNTVQRTIQGFDYNSPGRPSSVGLEAEQLRWPVDREDSIKRIRTFIKATKLA